MILNFWILNTLKDLSMAITWCQSFSVPEYKGVLEGLTTYVDILSLYNFYLFLAISPLSTCCIFRSTMLVRDNTFMHMLSYLHDSNSSSHTLSSVGQSSLHVHTPVISSLLPNYKQINEASAGRDEEKSQQNIC